MIKKSLKLQFFVRKTFEVGSFLFMFLFLPASYFLLNGQNQDSLLSDRKFSGFHEFLKEGEWSFHTRTMAMTTINRKPLLQYSALATGAGMGYSSPAWNGLYFGVSGYFIFKLMDQNLGIQDPLTGVSSRYEATLFDMENPENAKDLDRLEELYAGYRSSKFRLTIGRQILSTPFLNSQDNRMRPNLFSGLSTRWYAGHWELDISWITGVSPRGTVRWYSMESSLGVYPFGRNTDGTVSLYKNNIDSKGLGIASLQRKSENWNTQWFYYYAHNLFHLTYADISKSIPLSHNKISAGLQVFGQWQSGSGGHHDSAYKYIQEGEKTWGVGGRIMVENMCHQWSINGLYIHDRGRFLFPREWGRERFWISLPRERMEGNGGLWALTTQWSQTLLHQNMNVVLGSGVAKTHDFQNASLNKYGMPSWFHLASHITYELKGAFEGVQFESLLVYKRNLEKQSVPNEFAINRIDLWHFSFIFDYQF
ncbi:MAG TPA: OprD family outer membrane porin [Saprospiraceae bacterium]|nr:OprD family outer membrane porin [Saprospiraceae bacterium]